MSEWTDYLSGLDTDKRRIVLSVLEIVKKYSAGAQEAMPYGVPGYKLNGKPLIAVAAHKEHYGVYPFSPKVIEGLKPLLGNHETAKGTIRFNYDDFPSDELIKRLIELRIQEITRETF